MPETLFINDFKSGWCPSDDAINGRPNGLLQMDNLELDKNGALTLTGGTVVKYTGYSAKAHTLFSRYMNGSRIDYATHVDGTITRNGASIGTGGDSANGAFSSAFNYALICSGSKRYKDTGSGTPVALGVGVATVAPTIGIASTVNTPWTAIGTLLNTTVFVKGTGTPISGYLQCTTDAATGLLIVQTYPSGSVDCTKLTGHSGDVGNATDEDFVTLNGYIANPAGVSFELDLLLSSPSVAGDLTPDYYGFTIADLGSIDNGKFLTFDTQTGAFSIKIARNQFTRIGNGPYDWSAIYGFRITINVGVAAAVTFNLWGIANNSPIVIQGGSDAQFASDIQYAQVNVNNTGSYNALSTLGPTSTRRTIYGTQALVSPQTPTDAQVNEVWIFRRGGNLGGTWYRVAKITSSFSTQFYDTMGDQDALTLNIKFNPNFTSTAALDKIFDIVGPIGGRWFYFTANMMYPSDINNPDLVDTSIAVRTCGSNNEQLMWARAISASVVLVGTTVNIYLLTGTFNTFPDGTIDVYYQPLGVTQFPPITYDAVSYGGAVYYWANDGIRMCMATSFGTTYSSQNNQLLVAPNLDRLYRGETCYGYNPPNLRIAPGSVRFPITIVRNKLWVFITGTGRIEVYDFARSYWRPISYGLGDVSAVTNTQDGQVLGLYTNDLKMREICTLASKLVDGSTQQIFSALFMFMDHGKPRQRKDSYTAKCRCYTSSSGFINLKITNENNVQTTCSYFASNTLSTEQHIDLSIYPNVQLVKSYQINLFGIANDVCIEDFSIDYDAHPIPLTYFKLQPDNWKAPIKKRARTWPIVIDTMGNNVTVIPDVDRVAQNFQTLNINGKGTGYYFFDTDVFGIDYGITLYDASGMMEVYEVLPPDFVQALPMPRRFDQVGPQEFLRFGKIVKMELRVIPFGGTSIPFKIYFSDTQIWTGTFIVVDGKEDSYFIDLPKGVSGRILRVELGPTAFNFHRYYMRFLNAPSGGQENTELNWLTIPGGIGV